MANLTITKSDAVMDATYFTRSDVEPSLKGDELVVYEGHGRSRSWGRPQVWSTVVLESDDLVAVHIGYNSKHGGGQFWRFYVPLVGGEWGQLEWRALPDALRQRVLDAAKAKAPSWAKSPGKLRAEKKAPTLTMQTAYKVVRITDDGRMLSLFDGETVYELGKRVAQKAEEGHNGGFYSYPKAEACKRLFMSGELVPDRCYEEHMQVALVEVEISGTIVRYGGEPIFEWTGDEYGMEPTGWTPTKLASTYLRPVRIVETFSYQSAVTAQ